MHMAVVPLLMVATMTGRQALDIATERKRNPKSTSHELHLRALHPFITQTVRQPVEMESQILDVDSPAMVGTWTAMAMA